MVKKHGIQQILNFYGHKHLFYINKVFIFASKNSLSNSLFVNWLCRLRTAVSMPALFFFLIFCIISRKINKKVSL